MKIYWKDEHKQFQEEIHILYLEKGNLEEILNMSYWRFMAILQTLHKKRCIESGKLYVEPELSESAKDMIAKKKAQRK